MIRKCDSIPLTAFLFFLICASTVSCINQKKITYFNNLPDSSLVALASLKTPEQLIQVNDVLNITLGGENEKTVQYLNHYSGGGSGSTSEGAGGGGLLAPVDIDGNITLPKIGKLMVLGLTKDQARDLITKAYSVYLKDVIVSVSFNNFKFTILGEVKNPGYFSVQNDRINLFEAMALAGDMTEYAKKNDVKIIRDIDGKREVVTVNFNDKSILNSPYYYINRNDIIYVGSRGIKLTSENFTRTAGIITTLASIITIFLVIFKK